MLHHFIDKKEFAAILGVSVYTLDRIRKRNPEFPKPYSSISRKTVWDICDPEVEEYIKF